MSEAIQETTGGDEDSMADVLREKAKTSKRVAWLLDECIKIPGTNIKFGLDPIIGMLPWGGDFTSTLIGAAVLTEAAKKGIPFGMLFKMGGNMLVNALGGLLPGLGDLFSAWFKSNKRNYELLNDFLDNEDGETKGGWGPLILAGFIILAIICVNVGVLVCLILAGYWLKGKLGFGDGEAEAVTETAMLLLSR